MNPKNNTLIITLLIWTLASLAPAQTNLMPPTGVAGTPDGELSQEDFELAGVDLKDPSSLLDMDDTVARLPEMPEGKSPAFQIKGPNNFPPLTSPGPFANGPDPDAELATPDPTASVISPLVFPNVAPMAASSGSTLVPPLGTQAASAPTTPPPKKGPLVLAPGYFGLRDPATDSAPQGTYTEKIMPPPTVPAPPMKGVSDVSIILSNNEFFPSKVILKEGSQIRLIFTTVNKKPAALVIEKLQIQRWVAKENEPASKSELDRSKFEMTRELVSSRITEVVIDPKPGTYSFHDVITGASGEISVEQ